MALPIRTQADFAARREEIRRDLPPRGVQVLQVARGIVEARAVTLTVLDRLERANPKSAQVRDFLRELRDDLDRLTPADCLHRYDGERLTHICRYLRALALRAERGLMHLEKARTRSAEIREYSEKLASLEAGCGDEASPLKRDGLEQLRWMIEEYKVSLFAQELKTPYPISKKRLDEKIEELIRIE
jgi:ATP-dependent helicase HrpA